MFSGVDVQHEVLEGSLQQGSCPIIVGEASPGDLSGSLQVQDSQFGAQFDMVADGEVEIRRIAHEPDHFIGTFVAADRDAIVR